MHDNCCCFLTLYLRTEDYGEKGCVAEDFLGRHELLDWNGIPEHMREWIADYPMILVDIFRFPDWEKFQTDLREVFGFIQSSRDINKMKFFLKDNAERFSSMAEDACDLIEEVTGTKEIRQFRREKKERKQNMCKAIDDMMKENYDNGFEEGQKSMCKAMDDMMKEKEKQIRELEKEVLLLKAKLSA